MADGAQIVHTVLAAQEALAGLLDFAFVVGAVGAQAKMANSRSIVYTAAADYDAIFVCGGYGITWDGAFNRELKRLLEDTLFGGRIVAAVGHGPCSLVTLTDRAGRPYVAGKQVNLHHLLIKAEVSMVCSMPQVD